MFCPLYATGTRLSITEAQLPLAPIIPFKMIVYTIVCNVKPSIGITRHSLYKLQGRDTKKVMMIILIDIGKLVESRRWDRIAWKNYSVLRFPERLKVMSATA